MSRTLKWVLGIVAVLVVLAVAAGAVWFLANRVQMMAAAGLPAQKPNSQVQPNNPNGPSVPGFPNGPRGFNDDGRNPQNGYGDGFRGPMMGGRGRMRFMGLFGMGFFFLAGLLRLIIPLGVLVLVAILFYQLGKRSRPAVAPVARREVISSEPPSSGSEPPKGA